MPRPFKKKIVEFDPKFTYFKPPGIPLKSIKEIIISFEEFEAMRLKDYEGLSQVESAKKMNIHQSTFQRLLTRARNKILSAFINGYAIKIEGGDYIKLK